MDPISRNCFSHPSKNLFCSSFLKVSLFVLSLITLFVGFAKLPPAYSTAIFTLDALAIVVSISFLFLTCRKANQKNLLNPKEETSTQSKEKPISLTQVEESPTQSKEESVSLAQVGFYENYDYLKSKLGSVLKDHDKKRLHYQDDKGRTPLLIAFIRKDIDLVFFFLEQGADFHEMIHKSDLFFTEVNLTPITLDFLSLLQTKGIDIFKQDSKTRETLLHKACRKNALEIVTTLYQLGADFLLTDGNKKTPLHLAIESKCYDIAIYVIDALVSISEKMQGHHQYEALHLQDKDGNTPFHLHCCDSSFGIYYQVKSFVTLSKAMIEACNFFPSLLKLKNNKNRTLLHEAIESQFLLTTLEPLIDISKSCLNDQDIDGNTPLHLAAKTNQFSIIKDLLKRGASCKIKNTDGFTPLEVALFLEKLNYIQTHCELSCFPKDQSALHFSIKNKKQNSALMLISKGYSFDHKEEGLLPEDLALMMGDFYLFCLIVNKKTQDFSPHNPCIPITKQKVELAVIGGVKDKLLNLTYMYDSFSLVESITTSLIHSNLTAFKTYCEAGFFWPQKHHQFPEDLLNSKYLGHLFEHIFKSEKPIEFLQLIDEQRKKITSANLYFIAFSYFHYCKTDCEKLYSFLVKYGASPGIIDTFGNTVTHFSVNNIQTLKILASNYKSHLDIANHQGLTPFLYSILYGNDECTLFLQDEKNIHSKNPADQSCLHLAAIAAKPKLIITLLKNKADPFCLDISLRYYWHYFENKDELISFINALDDSIKEDSKNTLLQNARDGIDLDRFTIDYMDTDRLPDELLVQIVEFLPSIKKNGLAVTCKKWNNILKQTPTIL